jgi:hypothetical protein
MTAADVATRIAQLEAELAATRAENERLRGQQPTSSRSVEAKSISGPTITCPGCGDVTAAPNGDPEFLAKTIARCHECGVRIVYGELGPRPVVEPGEFSTKYGPRPALLFRFQDAATQQDVYVAKLDPEAAFLLAQAAISLVRP